MSEAPIYKQVRKDGRYVTIDTRTGEEVAPFEGQLKPVGDFFRSQLQKAKTTLQVGLSDLTNLPGDVLPHLIYSDTAVDEKGRPLTKAQAGEHNYNREERIKEILKGSSAKPAATAKPLESSRRNITSIGGKDYDLSDPTQKAAYDKVIAADRATRPGQKFPDLRGGGGLKPDGSGRNAEPPTPNPNGVAQTGTSMGISSLSMKDAKTYVGKDVQIANPFLSNALPGTNDDGYSYDDDRVMGASKAEAATRAGGGFVESVIDKSGTVETKMVQGSPNLVLSGTGSAAPSDVKTNDINDPSTWDENYARRRAFLDADSSMAGLKAVQAQKGIVYAGDKYYMNTGKEDDKGNPVLNAIEGPDAKKDVRAYINSPLGAQGAEDLKNKYIDKITNKTEEEEDNK